MDLVEHIGSATYDPTGVARLRPTTFSNYRQGGYVSLGYRPTEVDNKILQNLEFLARYDSLATPLILPAASTNRAGPWD